MQAIFTNFLQALPERLRHDIRLRVGAVGAAAGASLLLSAGVMGLGGSFTPSFLHASSASERPIIPQERIVAHGLSVVDMSTSTVFEIIQSLPKAERFEMMLYNSGADEVLKERGTYTVFVPSSSDFDYLPRGYIASLKRSEAYDLALGHITSRALPLNESLNGDVITLGKTLVSFEVSPDGDSATVGGAKVLRAYEGSNGYVYIINQVLSETE